MTLQPEQLEMFAEKLANDLLKPLGEGEMDRRLRAIQSSLGLLEQMLKLPAGLPTKVNKYQTLKSILRDLLGVRGELYTVGGGK